MHSPVPFRVTLDSDYQAEEAAKRTKEALMLAADATLDLLLLDITMPGLGGYKTCRRLKSAPDHARKSSWSQRVQLGGADRGLPRGDRRLLSEAGHPCDLRSRVQLQLKLRESLQNTARLKNEVENFHGMLLRTATERAQQIIALQDVAEYSRWPESPSGATVRRSTFCGFGEYAEILAEDLAQRGPYVEKIDEAVSFTISTASSPLHDIGKVGISDEILLEAGRSPAMSLR